MTFQIFNDLPQLPPTSPSDAGKEVAVNSSGAFDLMNPLSYKYKISDTEDRDNYTDIANNESPREITQLSLEALTPRSMNSKIKLHGAVCGGWDAHSYDKGIIIGRNVDGQDEEFIRAGPIAGTDPSTGDPWVRTRLLAAWLGDSHHFNNLAPANLHFLYIDDPHTTSAIIYKIYLVNTRPNDTRSFYLNSTSGQDNASNFEVGVSTFIAQEI